MKYFKDDKGEVYAYADDGSQDALIGDKVAITKLEAEAHLNPVLQPELPNVVTMRQARLALLEMGLLATVSEAVANGTDESIKIEWEYSTEINRDSASLIALSTVLGMSSDDLDNIFLLAGTL